MSVINPQINKPTRSICGQAYLLALLIQRNGGTRASAKLIKLPEGAVNMWKRRGKVPLKHVARAAAAWNVLTHALNYVEVAKLVDCVSLSWAEVVKATGLSEAETSDVLKCKEPKL